VSKHFIEDVGMAQKRWRRERWISVVREFESSGMAQREFAQKHRLKLSTLQSWIYKLRREKAAEEPPVRFVEITGADSPAALDCVASVEWPDGPRVVFNELPDAAYMATLLRCLVEVPEC
jgi:hypothetical protein